MNDIYFGEKNSAVESKNVIQEKLCFQQLKVKKLLKNLKTRGWKQKNRWKIWKQLKTKKLLKNLETSGESKKVAKKSENQGSKAKTLFKKNDITFVENVNEKVRLSGWTNWKVEKKLAFLILNCVESRLNLNRSFNRSRWVFFSKVYIIRNIHWVLNSMTRKG